MMANIYRFALGRLKGRTLMAALAAAAIGVLSVLTFRQDAVAALAEARGASPLPFALLGLGGSASLMLHAQSVSFGLLLPLLVIVHVSWAAPQLITAPLQRGEMAYLLASPQRRGAIALAHALALFTSVLLVCAASFTASMGTAAWQFGGQMDWLRWAQAHGALLALGLMATAWAFYCACAAQSPRAARRRAAWPLLLLMALWMAARAVPQVAWLRYLTPFSLFDAQGLILAKALAHWLAFLPLAFAALFTTMALRAFGQRELPL